MSRRPITAVDLATVWGFTGTRQEPSLEQKQWGDYRIRQVGMRELHHGACLGSDMFAHMVGLEYWREWTPDPDIGDPEFPIHVHPPIKKGWMMPAHLLDSPLVEVLKAKDYLARDRDIAVAAHRLLATPKDGWPGIPLAETSGGTWYTISYALALGKVVEICYPNGQVEWREP